MSALPLPTGTVTFLFTDIEGSTQLQHRLGPEYAAVRDQHHHLLRAAFAVHGGVEVDTQGDAFFVAFPTAPAAVAAASDATRALATHAWPDGVSVRVRMGLHTGAPLLTPAGYVGLDVVRAARIAAAGHGGQILLSEATRALVEDALPGGATLRDLDAHRLKDMLRPERLAQLDLPGLPVDFPPLKTLDAHPHNLPIQPTPLLGRVEQVAALAALLRRDDARLVTLTGPGGIGKTRLSLEVAAEALDGFPDGVWFVRLSRLTDPALVLPTIAQTLELREQGETPLVETLRASLRAKRLLLVLDNFEQVVAAAPEVGALLAACANLRVLVTSLVPLHLRGERDYALAPLPLPAPGQVTPERLTQYAAVALFIERAQAARADFVVTAANAPVIAEICARLQGLPLAIELAAARAKLLPPEALLGRLSRQLALLTGGARDLEERQQTMRATIAWSEGLLSSAQRTLLRRLAVFSGGCALEAAEAVCTTPTGAEPLDGDILDGLDALVDHSLLQQREESGEARFNLLHVVREYALEQLEASGEADALRRTHAAYYLTLVEAAASELPGPHQRAFQERLEREQDNLRAALVWAEAVGDAMTGLRFATAMGKFWRNHGHFTEGRAWLEGFLALARPDAPVPNATLPDVRPYAYYIAGMFAEWLGDHTAAAARLETSLSLARSAGDRQATALALLGLGQVADGQGEHARAERFFEEALSLYRELRRALDVALALNELALSAYYQGQLGEAQARAEEAVRLYRGSDDLAGTATALDTLARVVVRQGNVQRAAALGREALDLWQRLGFKPLYATALELAAMTAGIGGDGARAARFLGAAAAIRESVQVPWPDEERADVQEAVAAARAALGEERWAAAFAAGRELTLEQAIAQTLGES